MNEDDNQHAGPKNFSKRAAQDESIMATNNSSIVSKRSVERLYYIEPYVFRPFVKKPQRRSPLINRGYWLRMHAIQYVVKQFLQEASTKRKIIVNLGCGYDPLAFQVIPRCRGYLAKTLFVDVDYPQLIRKKVEVVRNDRELSHVTGINCTLPPSGPVILRSDNYLAIGCDLKDIRTLGETLEKELEMPECVFLLIAEVSITYMDVKNADAVIQWAAKLGDARFCLLEQCLPNGADHPFAQTMLKHFNNLRTSLNVVHQYPSPASQQQRFLDLGWQSARGRTLWDLWGDDKILNAWQRASLNTIEPFDEWEEFALFASHYLLLVATKLVSPELRPADLEWYLRKGPHTPFEDLCSGESTREPRLPFSQAILGMFHNDKTRVTRRFGALAKRPGRVLELHGGLELQARTATSQLFGPDDYQPPPSPPNPMKSRVFHTITLLSHSPHTNVMVGGRASPDEAFSDCWSQVGIGDWREEPAPPRPLYRHSAVRVCLEEVAGPVEAVLVYGGRSTSGKVMNEWYLFQYLVLTESKKQAQWSQVLCEGVQPTPRFGSALLTLGESGGLLLGGMGEDGTVLLEMYQWSLRKIGDAYIIRIENSNNELLGLSRLACRIGATATQIKAQRWVIVGGISTYGIIPHELEILVVDFEEAANFEYRISAVAYATPSTLKRPLLIGHHVAENLGGIVIAGGGANCFSFGTCWNSGLYFLWEDEHEVQKWHECKVQQSSAIMSETREVPSQLQAGSIGCENAPTLIVQRVNLSSQSEFQSIVREAKPVIIEGFSPGPCSSKWTLSYLKDAIGLDRQVVVHESKSRNMSFQKKNFKYITKAFGTFVDEISASSGPQRHQYLRSLAAAKPADTAANFFEDYPELASDVDIPAELSMVLERIHSSVLRIAGDVGMWLHYDVMANILIPFSSSKTLLLYSPSQITQLSFPPGSTTSTLSPFDQPSILPTPIRVPIPPSSALYIPPLWSHAAQPPSAGPNGEAAHSIALNVFFHSFPDGTYAAGRDVYGNRDLRAYEQGRVSLQRTLTGLNGMEVGDDVKGFYAERLAMELLERARIWREGGVR